MVGTHFKRFRALLNLPRGAARFIRDVRGNIGVMTALLIIPIVGALGLATEGAGWFLVGRAAQVAADQGALAAAANDDAANGGVFYISEGRAAAAKYGFTNGANNTTVAVSYKTIASIPQCAAASCFEVAVTKTLPLALTQIVGYTGNGGANSETIQAVAVATNQWEPINNCIVSLDPKGGITFKGAPDANLAGCTLESNGDVTCDGHDGGFKSIVYNNKNKKCAPARQGATADPYGATYQKNVPASPCGGKYTQEGKGGAGGLPPANQINQLTGIPAIPICGDTALTGNLSVTSKNQVLVIENGVLDLNGFTLSTAAGAGLTIVFTGTNGGGYSHYPTGGGTLNIAAPDASSGSVWKGVAIWQDNTITNGVDFTYTGNTPTWDISGLVYLPNANIDFKGAVNKSGNGFSCFTLVVGSVTVQGTADIFSHEAQCAQAGVAPSGTGIVGAQLVY